MTSTSELEPELWLERHGDFLYRYALIRLKSPELAADCLQDTLLEAFRGRVRFESRSTERTWLIGILRHKILDQYRIARRERATRQAEELSTRDADSQDFDDRGRWRVGPRSWGRDAWAELERDEFWEIFRQCLQNMPPHLSEVFLLREMDGLESPEICQQVGISNTNLWARLHRARMRLRDCLERRWFGPEPRG